MRPTADPDARPAQPTATTTSPLRLPPAADERPDPLGPPDFAAFLAARERFMATLRPVPREDQR